MIEFAPLLTLEATHAYHGGRSPDFEYFVPAPTRRRLAGGRCLGKPRDGLLTVLYEKGAGGAPLVPLAGETLQFGLRLGNAHFCNFTALPAAFAEPGVPLYRNAGADPAVLQPPVSLLLNPEHEEDRELMREGPFCLVEIALQAAFYAAPPAFQVAFEAREETLKYYVVARNYADGEFGQLAVSDAGFGTDGRPRIDFTRVAASDFAAEDPPPALLAGGGEAKVTLFRSQQPVARQEKARKRIQLARSTNIIIPHLPQPGAAAATASLVVHLSKP